MLTNDYCRFEVLGGGGAPGQVAGDDSVVVEAPAPPVNLPSISDLPEPDLGPHFTPANTVPHNTVPGSDARTVTYYTTGCPKIMSFFKELL